MLPKESGLYTPLLLACYFMQFEPMGGNSFQIKSCLLSWPMQRELHLRNPRTVESSNQDFFFSLYPTELVPFFILLIYRFWVPSMNLFPRESSVFGLRLLHQPLLPLASLPVRSSPSLQPPWMLCRSVCRPVICCKASIGVCGIMDIIN